MLQYNLENIKIFPRWNSTDKCENLKFLVSGIVKPKDTLKEIEFLNSFSKPNEY